MYIPKIVVQQGLPQSETVYYCYLIQIKQHFEYPIRVEDIVLAVRTELEADAANFNFDMDVDRGVLSISLKYVGAIQLEPSMVC